MSARAESVSQELVAAEEIQPITLDSRLLTEVNEVRYKIAVLANDYKDVPDVTTEEGMARAMVWKGNVVSLRTRGKEAVKQYTKPLYDGKKAIDDMWRDDLLVALLAIEEPIVAAINAEKNRIENERIADEKRKTRIREHIHYLDTTPATLITLATIEQFVEILDSTDLADFDEFVNEATLAIAAARKTLAERHKILTAQAQAEATLAKQKAEQARRQAELDAQQERLNKDREELDTARNAAAAPATPAPAPAPTPVRTGYTVRRAPDVILDTRPAPEAATETGDFEHYMNLEHDSEALRLYLTHLKMVNTPELKTQRGREILAFMTRYLLQCMDFTEHLVDEEADDADSDS